MGEVFKLISQGEITIGFGLVELYQIVPRAFPTLFLFRHRRKSAFQRPIAYLHDDTIELS